MGKTDFPQPWPDRQHDPAVGVFAITPGTSEFAHHTRGIYVGTAGNVVVVTLRNEEVLLTNVQDGTILPIRVKKVLATGTDSPASTTTATNIVGLY